MIAPTTQKVVFVGTKASVFMLRTAEELRNRGIAVEIIDPYEAHVGQPEGGKLRKLLRLVDRAWLTAKATRRLDRDQTVVIHFLSIDIFWISPLLKRHFHRVVGLAYGSDILRRVKTRDWLFHKGLKRLDCIAATNVNVRDAIVADFPDIAQKETPIIRFGLPVFDALEDVSDITAPEARAQLGYQADKPLVCLGYTASPGQRQQELIAFFVAQSDLLATYQFVVPVQYGSPKVRSAVQVDCQRINQTFGAEVFHSLSTFHEPDTAALMRLATTVLINHSISDAFSGTVQEVIYAGNVVLAARHLPYSNMPGFGTAITPYDTLNDCVSALHPDALAHWQETAAAALPVNRDALRNSSSWEGVINGWYALIDTHAPNVSE